MRWFNACNNNLFKKIHDEKKERLVMKKTMKKNLALAALVAVSVAGYAPSAHAASAFGTITNIFGGLIDTYAPEYSEKFESAVDKIDPDFVEAFDKTVEDAQTRFEDASQELKDKDKEEIQTEVFETFEEVLEQVVTDPNKREEILGAAGEAFDQVFDQIVKPGEGGNAEETPDTKEESAKKVEAFFKKLAERWEAVDKEKLAADIQAGAETVIETVVDRLGIENKDQLETQIKNGLAALAGRLEGLTEEQAKAEFDKVVNNVVSNFKDLTQDEINAIKSELKAGLDKVFTDAKAQAEAAKKAVDKYHAGVAKEAVDAAVEKIEQKYDAEIARLDNRITRLEDRVDKVGAMAAAMASLKTMGYDPAAPTEIAVGLGQYRDQTGIAVGAFHYPNKNFMLNMSVTTAGDEVMGGIGATWKIGRKK